MIVSIFSLLLNYVKLTFLLAHFDWIPVLKINYGVGEDLHQALYVITVHNNIAG